MVALTMTAMVVQTLALSGAGGGGFDSGEMLRLCLDSAAQAEAATGAGQAAVQAAAASIVQALAADDAAFDAWPVRMSKQSFVYA